MMASTLATSVYALCALTSLACALLLLRGFKQSGARLLLWSAVCFIGFFLNNALLLVDTRFVPDVDLSFWRTLPSLLGVAALLYGLVWEARN
jgi:hypothetical protein